MFEESDNNIMLEENDNNVMLEENKNKERKEKKNQRKFDIFQISFDSTELNNLSEVFELVFHTSEYLKNEKFLNQRKNAKTF